MKKICLMLLLLIPLLTAAREQGFVNAFTKDLLLQQGEISLTEGWKFKNGDDSIWAAKNYNDSNWSTNGHPYLNLTNKDVEQMGFTGLGWFRFHFHTDTSLCHFPVALQLVQNGSSAIYLDGSLVKQYGSFTKNGEGNYVNPKARPLLLLIPDSGWHVFAVKYENYNAAARFKKMDDEQGGFVLSIAGANNAMDRYIVSDRSTALISLTSGCIFFALFLVHLILFMFYKADKSNLYFSLFNLGISSFIFLVYIGMLAQGVAFQDTMGPWIFVFLTIACLSISMFINIRFGRSKVIARIIWTMCIAEMVLTFIDSIWASYLMSVVAIVSALEAVVLLTYAMYKKMPGSKIIGTGILFFVFFFASVTVLAILSGSGTNINTSNSIWALALVILGILAVFSIPFSMSAYLAWSFATVNKELGSKLKQVEQLSQEAIQLEQEKQQLLERKKEELEEEVAMRTSEVIHQKEQIEQQHEALKAEKRKSDELLLNILPAEVAEELKEKGASKAQSFDDVTVLFTDFVNFTQIAERLSAEALVAELHECFMAFDAIMERHGMEKIKTIGDAYLAVSGMPVYNEKHAKNAVLAGLEILDFVKHRNQHENTFKIRIGVHSGPLIAGIVGVKKFAYDIWGDTVNTASRMESSGEAGKINISEATHKLVENDFTFTYRGKIQAKNKGAIDMYFVDGLIY